MIGSSRLEATISPSCNERLNSLIIASTLNKPRSKWASSVERPPKLEFSLPSADRDRRHESGMALSSSGAARVTIDEPATKLLRLVLFPRTSPFNQKQALDHLARSRSPVDTVKWHLHPRVLLLSSSDTYPDLSASKSSRYAPIRLVLDILARGEP